MFIQNRLNEFKTKLQLLDVGTIAKEYDFLERKFPKRLDEILNEMDSHLLEAEEKIKKKF